MKTSLALAAAISLLSIAAFADDRLRDVQTELKTQGFYYGEINGQNTGETAAALKRYQIRNGLEVTGTMNDETLKALGIGVVPGVRVPQEAPVPSPAAKPAAPRPPVNLRRDESIEDSDRNFLRREESHQRSAEPSPPLADEPEAPAPRYRETPSDFTGVFAGTPFASAPAEVQETTLRRAQRYLASRGLYREEIDGVPGPATEEAILGYQRSTRLPLTGRLDLETLSMMHLLPGTGPAPIRPFPPYPPERRETTRIYRGIWIR